MSLLRQIQDAAIGGTTAVSDLLRRCQILAFRLEFEPLKAWALAELNGYADEDMPAYRRGLRGIIKAHTSGPFGSGIKNVTVATSLLPAWYREKALDHSLGQGVAELEALVTETKTAGAAHVSFAVPPEIYAPMEVIEGHSTIAMWSEVSLSKVEGILDQIRNRALTFTLELEAISPKAGEADSPSISPSELDRIFTKAVRQ